MAWHIWRHGTDEKAVCELIEMIRELIKEAVHSTEDPYENLNEWIDAGIVVIHSPIGVQSILVFHEMQETCDGGMRPGYTLTIQLEDGQQETETFFDDDTERWDGIATDFACRIACPPVEDIQLELRLSDKHSPCPEAECLGGTKSPDALLSDAEHPTSMFDILLAQI